MTAAVLGVLKAGGAYLPLSTTDPADRIATILADSGAAVILADTPRAGATAAPGRTVIDVSALPAEADAAHADDPPPSAGPQDIAYCIYASGSTGVPNGVLVEHRSLVNRLRWMIEELRLTDRDVVLHKTPYVFDVSVWELLLPGVIGSRQVMLAPGGQSDPALIRDAVEHHGVTLLHFVPSMLSQYLSAVDAGFTGVRHVVCSGEALGRDLATRFFAATTGTGTRLHNYYGPTEATVDVCRLEVCDTSGPVTIGRPAPNTRVYVLDGTGRPCPVGVPGELYISGVQAARGYLNRPEKTAADFTADPFRPGARMYRTGDLVRWQENGEVVYLGRRDSQVKLRGFRIELGEVEHALAGQRGVERAAAMVRKDASGTDALWAYAENAVPGAPAAPAELREALGARLPEYMVPTHFVFTDTLPVTRNGKTDRRALLALSHTAQVSRGRYVAPRTSAEQRLAAIWQELLRLERVGAEDDFFAVGGNSLSALQLSTRIGQAFGIEMKLAWLFTHRSVAAQAALVADAAAPAPSTPALVRVPRGERHVLSFAQERMWFLHMLDPDSGSYNIPVLVRLRGAVDAGVMEQAVTSLVARHEMLRTTFVQEGGEVFQRVRHDLPVPYEVRDLGALPDEEARAEAARQVREISSVPFPLEDSSPLRVVLFRLGDEEWQLLVVVHHTAGDGWTLRLMMQELSSLYAGHASGEANPLPAPAAQYIDYAAAVRDPADSGAVEDDLAYWVDRLADAPSLGLPTDEPDPAVPDRSGSLTVRVDPATGRGLRELAARTATTSFEITMAALTLLLSRLSGQEDVVVGFPVVSRPEIDLERTVGLFLNTLVLRTDLTGAPSLTELLERVSAGVREAYEHQAAPFELLVERLNPERALDRSPVFDVLLNYLGDMTEDLTIDGVTAEVDDHAFYLQAKFPLTIYVRDKPDGGMLIELVYRADLFSPERAETMAAQPAEVLVLAATDPGRPITWYALETGAARHQRAALAVAVEQPGQQPVPELIARLAARGALAGHADAGYDVMALDGTGLGGFLSGLYTAGGQWRWDAGLGPGRRIELPSYQFDRTRCWLDDSKLRTRHAAAPPSPAAPAAPAAVDPLAAVLEAWRDVLGETPEADASFFDLGGDSISGMQVMTRLSALFAVELPAGLDLPVSPGVGGEAFSGAYRDYALPEELWARLKRFAKAEGGTAFTSVVSAFAALLARYTDQGELVVGTSLSGRGTPGAEQLVAMLVRTLPLRVQVDDAAGFRALFAQVRSRFTAGARHSDYPYEGLVEELQRRGRTHSAHLFDVLIEFEQFAGDGEPDPHAMGDGNLRVTPVDVTLETSVFPLNIMLAEQPGTLGAAIRFDTRLFDARTVDRLWESFTRLLGAVLDRPDASLRQLPLLSQAEQRGVRALGAHDFAFDTSLRIHRSVERFARTSADRVCLVAGSEQRTYAELNARANRLARFFRDELEVAPEEIVALVMDRSILTVEAILALWKCGAAYLPIDPGYPPSYIRSMLESSRVRVVAVDPARVTPGLRARIGDECTVAGLTDATGADLEAGDLEVATSDSALSYVIYTSGSTGVPKGVMVEHLGMLNHLHAKINDLSLTERSVVVQNASNSFDISVWQMFAAPYVGGRTVIYQPALQLDPVRFGERLDADGVTDLEAVPSYLDTMLDAWEHAGRRFPLPALAHLMVTGEAVLPRSVNRWLAHYPQIPVVNAYGPTEASDDVTHHVMAEPVTTDTVPLGSPIHNTLIYVLDEHLRVCPQGTKGEIYVSGIGVSRGYLNAPEQTAEVFLRDPFQPERRMYRTGDAGRWTAECTLEYLGRTNSQVKIRGFRTDLGEIERRVDACPGAKAAAVLVPAGAKDRLCAFVVPEPGATIAECRTVLHGELPHYMVPADFVEIDAIPLRSNGKIDRKSLTRIDPPRPDASAVTGPRTELERALTGIWREVLGAEEIDVHDEFFEIGGNSLRAVMILSRIHGQLDVALDLEVLFAQPTIAALATAVEQVEGEVNGDEAIVSLGGPGADPIAHAQNLLLGMEDTYDRPDAFNRNDLYELHGDVDAAALELAFARLVERHETLRTTFARDGGRRTQIVHAPGALPLPFALHDFSGRPPGDARAFAEDRIRTPFAVTEEPLMRVDLLRTDARWLLVTSMHQLVSDGRTVDVLVEEWLRLYDAAVEGLDAGLAPLAVQYKDTAQWRNSRIAGERLREHRGFWLQELAGASSVIPLAADRPRPTRTAFAAGRLRRPIPDLAARLSGLAGSHGVTEFVVAKAAVTLLLLAETGGSEVTVGTYTRGRTRLDFENQLGNYINTVPLRTRLQPDQTVASFLRTAQQDALRALQHEEYPYEWTMRDLGWERGPDRSPLFDVMVAVAVAEAAEPPSAGGHLVEFRRLELPRRAKEADLQFVFDRTPDDGMEISVTYNCEIFDAARVERFAGRLEEVLQGLAANLPLIEILGNESNASSKSTSRQLADDTRVYRRRTPPTKRSDERHKNDESGTGRGTGLQCGQPIFLV
jgi:amino acid adenylation domain-containing protein